MRRFLKLLAGAFMLGVGMTSAEGQETKGNPRARQETVPSISEEACPLEFPEIKSADGRKVLTVVRRPPGNGPFPAVVYLHGGLPQRSESYLKGVAREGALTRWLAAGYVTVNPTFRSREKDPQNPDTLKDCLAVVDFVKKMPQVDPKSVVVAGDSGGGSLALEVAGQASIAAIVIQEPATILFFGMLTPSNVGERFAMMEDYKKSYTPDHEKRGREKIDRIGCPIFIGYGDVHAINHINNEVFVPLLKAAGKSLGTVFYPGQPHGFANDTKNPACRKFFEDAHAFVRRPLATAPVSLEASLVRQIPARSKW